jgi:CDP-glucose 4,6-dehydratase
VENLGVNAGFWKGRKVFLTGHTGFKGAWLALWLQLLGARVHGFSLQPGTTPSMFDACRIGDGMESEIGDIRDAALIRQAIERSGCEIVFHLAAQALVRESYADPLGTFATNVMGTANVLEGVRATPSVRAVVVITTDKCYENREWDWGYREIDPLGGHDPYSSSKACTELVAASYRSAFFTAANEHRPALATARAGNVIGGGDWSVDRLVPDAIRAFQQRQPVVVRNPDAIRPWQHVLEPLRGYMRLAEELHGGAPVQEAWNFGPLEGDDRPVSWLVEQLAQHWAGAKHITPPRDSQQPHEAKILRLDWSKARNRLQWSPVWRLETALAKTATWYRAFHDGGDIRALSEQQLAEYMGR